MESSLENLIGIKGLSQLRMGDLQKGLAIHDATLAKCELLDPGHIGNQILERHLRTLVHIVRATLSGEYPDLSVLAFARILVALDYFLNTLDRKPDTQIGGFDDDLEEINRLVTDLKTEIDEFAGWQLRQPS